MLITPKLHIPPLRPKMLPRVHLQQRLSEGWKNRLIFISGPAGSGKTSLTCQWLAKHTSTKAWYSLDESDNDPNIFLRYFLTALGMADRQLADEVEPWVQGHKSLTGQAVLPELANYLGRVTRDIVIILDDYHCITCSEIHEVLIRLLTLTLPKIHFFILSRQTLPFSIARMKVRNQVVEIASHDMKISPAETTIFFQDIMPVALSADQLQQLAGHMEGWLGGLQLLGMSLQNRNSEETVSGVLDKAYREAAEYLMDEVLNTQPEYVKTFLYATALFDRFSGSMVRQVCGMDEAIQVLDHVYANNLFLTSLDAEHTWYRYHHLFTRAVRRRALQHSMAMCRDICRRAVVWLAENRYLEDAFRQAFIIDDMAFAADLLEDLFLVVSDPYEMAFAHRWLSKLPPMILQERLLLLLQDCYLKIQLADLSNVSATLEVMEDHWAERVERYHGPKRKRCEEYRLLLNRILPYWYDPENVDIQILEHALQQISSNKEANAAFSIVVPFSHYYQGDLGAAHKSLNQVYEKVVSSGNRLAIMIWFRVASTVARLRGNLHRSEAIIYQALRLTEDSTAPHVPLKFMVDLPMAWLCYQRNDLDKARAYAETVLKYVEQTRFVYEIADVNYLLSLIFTCDGDDRRAVHCMERMQWAAGVITTPGLIILADARAARLSLIQGNLDPAIEWYTARKLSGEEPFSFRFAFECMVAAEVQAARMSYRPAIQTLNHLRKRCRSHQMLETVLEIDVMRAVNHQKLGEYREAQKILAKAFLFAQTQGYIRPFVDHVRWVSPILAMGSPELGGSSDTSFREIVSRACGIEPGSVDAVNAFAGPPLGKLTRREVDILKLMAKGYKNKEIAEKTFISLHTVKTHAKNIFEKLNVATRVQAVRRAQELKII